MTQQTNRIPGGFLDLIGAETGGKNPPIYDDSVQPTVDLFELYAAQTLSAFNTTIAHENSGEVVTTTVPDGEVWIVRAVSVLMTLGALTEYERWTFRVQTLPRLGPEESIPSPFPSFWTSRLIAPNLIANQPLVDSFALPAPLVCSPGVTLAARILERDAGLPRTTRLQWLISRLL